MPERLPPRRALRRRRSYVVDGGLLSNFPVDVFDRSDRPRWPTFGVKLSARPEANAIKHRVRGSFTLAKALISTMLSGRDQMHIDDPCTQRRTIFVDTLAIQATEFGLTLDEREALYGNGRRAAEAFLDSWNEDDYLRACRPGVLPTQGGRDR